MLWLMDWLMQEAAKDLVNAEEDETGEEQGGLRREGVGVGEGGGPALIDTDLLKEGGVGEKAEEGAWAEAEVGEERGSVLETEVRELVSGLGGHTGVAAEEHGDPWRKEDWGDGGGAASLRVGLKAEGSGGPDDVSEGQEVSREDLRGGRLRQEPCGCVPGLLKAKKIKDRRSKIKDKQRNDQSNPSKKPGSDLSGVFPSVEQ